MALFGLFGGSKDEAPRNDQLDHWVEDTLKRELKLDEIERDGDGDIPLDFGGSTMVFVRTLDVERDLPIIRVFAPLLAKFEMKPEVYAAVNSINRKAPLAKALVDPAIPQILLSADILLADEVSPGQLMATIQLVGENADQYDTMLQKRFGGVTMFDDGDDGEFDV